MKKIIFKIKAVMLAMAVLFASNSYAINSHFCGEELVAVSYFGDDVSCAMETTGDDCDDETSIKKDCCSDVLMLIEAEEFNGTNELFAADKDLLLFVAAFTKSYFDLFQEKTVLIKESFKDFSPPNTDIDIQVLYQTFLI